MSKFGLGRGLADIKTEMTGTSEISVLAGGERVVVRNIPIANIIPNPDQPRKTFTESELKDLTNSIAEKGVLQPILVRNSSKTPGNYEIIAGERRWRASGAAGLSEIPALVKTVSDDNAMEIALIENVQRENLNPIEEAAAYKNLLDNCAYTLGDIVQLIGKSESYIRNIMRLGSLPESVKDMVESGELSASHARTLIKSDDAERMAREILAKKLTVEDTAKMVKGKDDDANADKRKLESALSVPVKIKIKKGGAGEIILSFRNKFQMEQLIEKLCQ
ncbi:MAG: ParB/RepB/Spo0J family partition protein [Alphaproteobacteria bacterium]|nr:ParB/RepB/Spo0J family partition protein [Alphaproteobacteria bacterium]